MSIPSAISLMDKWKEELSSRMDKLRKDSTFVTSDKDFKLEFQKLYKNQEFLDFEITNGSDGQPIRAHKIYLIIIGFKSVKKCLGQTLTIDGDKQMIQSLIDCFYNRESNLEIDGKNIDEYTKIADQFEIEGFSDYLVEKKIEIHFFQLYQQMNEIETSLKRKSEFGETVSNKRVKTLDNIVDNELKTIPVNNKWIPVEDESVRVTNESKKDSINDSLEFSVVISDTSIESKDNQSITKSSDTDCSENNLVDIKNEVKSEENNVSLQENSQQLAIKETEKKLTTEITGFIPENDDSDVSTVEESSGNIGRPLTLTKKTAQRSQNPNFDFTKLLKSMNPQSGQSQRQSLNKIQIQSYLKRKSIKNNSLETETKTDEVIDNYIKYDIIKFLYQNKNNKSTQVWKSRFVPKRTPDEYQMVVVVGGPIANWFNLDRITPTSSTQPEFAFISPENMTLRSIAVTVLNNSNKSLIYAIGSFGCIYLLKDPTEKKVDIFRTIDGFVGKEEEVNDIAFHVTSTSILLFCGTSDKKIVVFELKIGGVGRNAFKCIKKIDYLTKFPVVSILYIEKYDCLVASGESPDLIIINDVSTFDEKKYSFYSFVTKYFYENNCRPIVGRITPKINTNTISSLVYIKEYDIMCFRAAPSEFLQTVRMDLTMDKINASKLNSNELITVAYLPGAKLQYRKCQIDSDLIEFIYMSSNGGLIACGDAYGNVHIYSCNQSLKCKNTTIQAIQEITYQKWPNPPPIIRSVSISDDFRYIVTTTNSNLIFVCEASQPSIN